MTGGIIYCRAVLGINGSRQKQESNKQNRIFHHSYNKEKANKLPEKQKMYKSIFFFGLMVFISFKRMQSMEKCMIFD